MCFLFRVIVGFFESLRSNPIFSVSMRSVIFPRILCHRVLCFSSRLHFSTANASTSTVDQEEIGRFSALASIWWKDDGPMKALRSMNSLRVPWIRDTLLQVQTRSGQEIKSPLSHQHQPLHGFRILDVGCGAGFLTEPLARLGANVVGIDPSLENIEVAKEHASGRKDELDYGSRLVYFAKTVEDLVNESELQQGEEQLFDAVVASEVVEHVSNRDTFVESCLRLAKSSGGCIFFTTINRTVMSRLLAIYMAENVLRIVPRGMHEWEKFTSPDDLQFLMEKNGDCDVRLVHGMRYNPITNSWSWTRYTSVNYALCGVKK